MNCIFCKIIAGEIPSKKVYEDENILAFYDIAPAAPVHIVIIPKVTPLAEHIGCIGEINNGNITAVSNIFEKIPEIAAKAGLSGGYRVITNNGADAGQTVAHLHFHILGGKALSAMG